MDTHSMRLAERLPKNLLRLSHIEFFICLPSSYTHVSSSYNKSSSLVFFPISNKNIPI
jgi:hypothetical protein